MPLPPNDACNARKNAETLVARSAQEEAKDGPGPAEKAENFLRDYHN